MDITDRLYQKLEKMDLPPTESHNVKVLIKQAIAAGLACNIPTNPLEGYSNLTAAIKAGVPIDWEELDGRKVQCVNPELRGELRGTLARDHFWPANSGSGWEVCGMGAAYVTVTAWRGKDGWALWIEGEIPLRRKTADQLKRGTYFLAKQPGTEYEETVYLGGPMAGERYVLYTPSMLKSSTPADKWEVLEEYGPFQKPEENKK